MFQRAPWGDGSIAFEGEFGTLRRFKEEVKEIAEAKIKLMKAMAQLQTLERIRKRAKR